MESYASFEGTILEVRRGYVRAVFSRSHSDKMEERGAKGTWRIDRYSPETTYQRQLKVDPLGRCRWSSHEGCLISALQGCQETRHIRCLAQHVVRDSRHCSCVHVGHEDMGIACT